MSSILSARPETALWGFEQTADVKLTQFPFGTSTSGTAERRVANNVFVTLLFRATLCSDLYCKHYFTELRCMCVLDCFVLKTFMKERNNSFSLMSVSWPSGLGD